MRKAQIGERGVLWLLLAPLLLLLVVGLGIPTWSILADGLSAVGRVAVTNPAAGPDYLLPALARIELTTLRIGAVVGIAATLLATFLTLLLRGVSGVARQVVLALALFPMGVHIAFRVFGVQFLLAPAGPFGEILFGRLSSILFTEIATVVGLVHWTFPVALLVLLVAAERLPQEEVDAAALLGAPPRDVVLRVVVPHLLPAMISAVTLTFCLAYGSFITPEALGGMDDMTVSRIIGALLREGRQEASSLLSFVGLLTPLLVFAGGAAFAYMAQRRLRQPTHGV